MNLIHTLLQQSPSAGITFCTVLMAGLLLAGCSTQPETRSVESVTASHTRFETAIADKILGEAVNTLPHLPASQRLNYLKRYLGQFESGVDLSRVSNRIKREGALLRFLTEVEATRQEGLDFAANLQQLSTLNRTPNEIEQALQQELRRIDQRLMADKPDSDIQSLIKVQRRAATYPADTADSKQQYLDDLSTAMLRTQADWHDLLIEYAPSVLAISGHESNQGPTFSYEARGLAINLGNPQDLPVFEIPCLAAYYGYPGLQAFSTQKQVGIKTLLDLPAYTHGWASYVVDLISEQPEGNQCLWFSRLQAVTALADLRFNRGEWTRQTALDYLEQNTPYNQSRLTGIVDEIITEPGRNLALFAGRLFFRELVTGCEPARDDQCVAGIHQAIIDLGPMPFSMLLSDLDRSDIFSVPATLKIQSQRQ